MVEASLDEPPPPPQDAAAIEASGEACCWAFRRPTTGSAHPPVPSPHVYVGNVAASSDAELRAAAAAFGTLLRLTRQPPVSAAYEAAVLTFSSTREGAEAQRRLEGGVLPSSSRPLTARFACLRPPSPESDTPPPPPPLPAARCASALAIPGLLLLRDFLSPAEEAALLAHLDRPEAPWERLARRRVLHEGHRFDYATRAADARRPLPAGFGPPVAALLSRLHQLPQAAEPLRTAEPGGGFDQMTVNDYAHGMGIASHCDTHSAFAPLLASVSIAGNAVMEFRRGGGEGAEKRSLHLPARSLLLLAGEARYGWEHAIPTRSLDRVVSETEGQPEEVVPRGPRRLSLTFRRLSPPDVRCACAWPSLCDTQLAAAAAAATAAAAAAGLAEGPERL